ncbi:Serine/threonine-protein kinase PknD [Sporomusa silvacetica DSM 10669]|uniref:Serine/threonine-protein kinase PknD n=1 Tax=Sporomusa silvacetica DSM 10669 TaxID=1123289 RepID=A0ABZ3ITP3_9FIRM|nr:protein kinase [Sporomusa silvacetica]OZC22025.1 serine/threonine-protein kinase PknB [Sporomusa silvacetica DSM 10669]
MGNSANENKNLLRGHIKSQGDCISTCLGPIKKLKQIGEGGNSLVFEGELFGIRVAIKFLMENSSIQKIIRFKAEYVNVNILPNNSYIAKMLNFEELKIQDVVIPMIIMKRYDGSLKDHLQEPKYEDLNKLFNFLISSLNFIHCHGIIHRDLKPENILVEGNKYVLADFGIANFDSGRFALRAKTQKGDRMANFSCSPSEQFEKGTKPSFTMDIYALGQICQLYSTGSAHRGTKRERITNHFPEAELIDYIVEKCLASNPQERFQSIEEIKVAIDRFHEMRKKVNPYDILQEFGDALAYSFPKGLGRVNYSEEPMIIDKLLNSIAAKKIDKFLEWNQGGANSSATLRKIDNSIWLVGNIEMNIKAVWVYFDSSFHRDFVILETKAMPSFGVNGEVSNSDEAGLLDEKYYISYAENNNGYAEINGQTIALRDHRCENRSRDLVDSAYVLGTTYSSAIYIDSDDLVAELLPKIKINKATSEDVSQFTRKIGRNKHRFLNES